MTGVCRKRCDAVVIGAGAAGMAAAAVIAESGFHVALIDREECPGGILLQCIHNGFGLHTFKREMTGPEYAEECTERLHALPVELYLNTTVIEIQHDGNSNVVTACSARDGVLAIQARAVVLAMGCRERNRGNIGIPGYRPAGVFTAGLAQRLLNIEGYLPGKKAVIIGSGDIGLIMARRMSWAGAHVGAVVEILPYPSGLTRNIVQCLEDFSIPLYLNHAVVNISGHDRVESVTVAPLDNGVPQSDARFTLACDTVLLSIGLIPENELSRKAGVRINPDTNGPFVDQNLQTSVEGVFACGNVLHVHDLVDFVSLEATRCGKQVVSFLNASRPLPSGGEWAIEPGANVRYVVPNRCAHSDRTIFFMRSLVVKEKATLAVRQGDAVIHTESLRFVRPAEMISFSLDERNFDRAQIAIPLEVSIA